jgi:hypothetical protein
MSPQFDQPCLRPGGSFRRRGDDSLRRTQLQIGRKCQFERGDLRGRQGRFELQNVDTETAGKRPVARYGPLVAIDQQSPPAVSRAAVDGRLRLRAGRRIPGEPVAVQAHGSRVENHPGRFRAVLPNLPPQRPLQQRRADERRLVPGPFDARPGGRSIHSGKIALQFRVEHRFPGALRPGFRAVRRHEHSLNGERRCAPIRLVRPPGRPLQRGIAQQPARRKCANQGCRIPE